MKQKDKIINDIITSFQSYKGRASFYCFSNDIIPEIIYNIIYRFTNKNNYASIFIVVDSYNTRKNISNYLNNTDLFKNTSFSIRYLSADYVKLQYKYIYDLIITVGVNNNIDIITKLAKDNKFILSILTKNIMNTDFIINLRKILPCIETKNLDNVVNDNRIYSPVEEYRYGINLLDADKELYNKYTEYITTSIIIFGNLSNIEKCKKGDPILNISAAEFRNTIAHENGWNEHLDTTIPFMKQIDDVYNPNTLFERACVFYNIAKQRRDLVCDNNAKLEIIKDICIENKNNKILIISKRGEFASKITKFLNDNSDLSCGDYHDCIEDKVAVNDNGVPILIKNGLKKGQEKILGSQAQSTINERLFNNGSIQILSIKSSSNTKLKIACNIVIITSPLCDDIINIKRRFVNIEFKDIPTKVYKIYCYNTIEHTKLNKEKENPITTIIDKTENLIEYDENSGDIVL